MPMQCQEFVTSYCRVYMKTRVLFYLQPHSGTQLSISVDNTSTLWGIFCLKISVPYSLLNLLEGKATNWEGNFLILPMLVS